jgi:transcription antitermination factor NusG
LIDPSDAPLPPRDPLADDWRGCRWYAVRVAPRTEMAFKRHLHENGVLACAPTARRWVKPRRRQRVVGRWRHVERPLLVGYVLVGIRRPGDWTHVRSHEGYGYVVSCEGEPLRIPWDAIKDLVARALGGEFDEDQRPRRKAKPYRIGAAVTVNVAGMLDVEAVVTGHAGDHVIVQLLRLGITARAPLAHVAPIVNCAS